MSKSNIEHLTDLLTTDEQREFLEAIAEDHETAISELKDELSEYKEVNESLNDLIEKLENENVDGLNEVQTGLGIIYWKADNLLLQSELETFVDNLKTKYP